MTHLSPDQGATHEHHGGALFSITRERSRPRERTPSPPVDPPVLLGAREVERLTGVDAERLRTWARRHDFPKTVIGLGGDQQFRLADLQSIVVAKQLIEAGEPVGSAIESARDGSARPGDLTALAATFEALDVPVVGYRGPEPLTVAFANSAARRSRGSDAGALLPPVNHPAARALQLLSVAASNESRTLWHPEWSSPDCDERLAVAFSLGSPLYHPAVVVVVDLPGDGADVVRRAVDRQAEEAMSRRWVRSLSRARRAFQTCSGPTAVQTSLREVVDEIGADDGFLVFAHAGSLHGAVSVRGRMHPQRLPGSLANHLPSGGPQWATPGVRERLGMGPHDHLVVPLVATGTVIGYACLTFRERCEVTPVAEETLLSFAALMATGIERDRAAARRER